MSTAALYWPLPVENNFSSIYIIDGRRNVDDFVITSPAKARKCSLFGFIIKLFDGSISPSASCWPIKGYFLYYCEKIKSWRLPVAIPPRFVASRETQLSTLHYLCRHWQLILVHFRKTSFSFDEPGTPPPPAPTRPIQSARTVPRFSHSQNFPVAMNQLTVSTHW